MIGCMRVIRQNDLDMYQSTLITIGNLFNHVTYEFLSEFILKKYSVLRPP